MHFDKLTTAQVYAIYHNKAHLKMLRDGAYAELLKKNLIPDEISKQPHADEAGREYMPLSIYSKSLLLILPLVILIPLLFTLMLIVQGAIASLLLEQGYQRKSSQYWKYIAIGYCLWTLVVLVLAFTWRFSAT